MSTVWTRGYIESTTVVRTNVCQRLKSDSVCMFHGDPADPEQLRGFLAGFFCNAAQDEHKPTKNIQPRPQKIGSFDQKLKVCRRKWRLCRVNGFKSLMYGGKFDNLRVLSLESTMQGGPRRPVHQPMMEYRSLALCDGAGIDNAGGSELLTDQEPGQPVQRVVVVGEDVANVLFGRVPVAPGLIKNVRPFHRVALLRDSRMTATAVPNPELTQVGDFFQTTALTVPGNRLLCPHTGRTATASGGIAHLRTTVDNTIRSVGSPPTPGGGRYSADSLSG